MSTKPSIQFIKGLDETVVPNVRLTVCCNVIAERASELAGRPAESWHCLFVVYWFFYFSLLVMIVTTL